MIKALLRSKNTKVLVTSLSITSLSLALVGEANAKRGPFPIVRTAVTALPYTFVSKLEEPTRVTELASGQADGSILLRDTVTVKAPVIDLATNLPVIGPDGKVVLADRTIPGNTILNPTLNPADDFELPIGVSVSHPEIADGLVTMGRFAYLGNVPRFESENMELFASKMGHSLRVKAWVTQATLNNYEFGLLTRFKGFCDAFMKPKMHFERLQNLKEIAANLKDTTPRESNVKKWTTVASYYANHLLENTTLDIYSKTSTEVEYRDAILTSMLRKLMNQPEMTIPDGLKLYADYKLAIKNNDQAFLAPRYEKSAALFNFHLGHRYASGALIDPTKPERLGFLTFVYPIAIDKRGPFKLPNPGFKAHFPLASSMESRRFSNRWEFEFGGFPFIQITPDGVAFHGPITMNSDTVDTWYLRRDDVSHSCMRMDPSDILEFRALMPTNMNQLDKLGRAIPLRITEWPDVTDADNNGTNEAMDVAYYTIPTNGSMINKAVNWKPENYNKNYWTKFFTPYVGQLASKNTFTVTSTPEKDPVTGEEKIVNRGVFTGLPRYKVEGGVLKLDGFYPEAVPVMTFPQRPTAIIQYREDGVKIPPLDEDAGDSNGTYPGAYFNKLGG